MKTAVIVKIISERRNILIISKPPGLVVHGDGRTDESTLVDWLLQRYPNIVGVGEPMDIMVSGQPVTIERPGIVHRLDRDTSGVMVVARTQEAFEALKQKFQNREVQKTYLAFVYGQPKEDKGSIDASIGKSPKDFRRWSAQPGARGTMRDAVTEWRLLARFIADDGDRYSLMVFRPKTGRTHQIRVHAKYMHHPIVSDPLYAGKRAPALGFSRQALHAHQIAFDWEGQQVLEVASLPEDFQRVIDQYNLDLSGLEKS